MCFLQTTNSLTALCRYRSCSCAGTAHCVRDDECERYCARQRCHVARRQRRTARTRAGASGGRRTLCCRIARVCGVCCRSSFELCERARRVRLIYDFRSIERSCSRALSCSRYRLCSHLVRSMVARTRANVDSCCSSIRFFDFRTIVRSDDDAGQVSAGGLVSRKGGRHQRRHQGIVASLLFARHVLGRLMGCRRRSSTTDAIEAARVAQRCGVWRRHSGLRIHVALYQLRGVF